MEINKIKISNKLMKEIVENLFNINGDINNKVLPINKKDVVNFREEYDKSINISGYLPLPYISFTSKNSTNELQVYINHYDVDTKEVTISVLGLKTRMFEKESNKSYYFTN